MCSPVVDCKTCDLIERCRRVALAFPTAAEDAAAMSENVRARYRNSGRKGRMNGKWNKKTPKVAAHA